MLLPNLRKPVKEILTCTGKAEEPVFTRHLQPVTVAPCHRAWSPRSGANFGASSWSRR